MRKSNITPEDAPGCDICRVHYVIILPVVTAVLLELRSSAMSDGARGVPCCTPLGCFVQSPELVASATLAA